MIMIDNKLGIMLRLIKDRGIDNDALLMSGYASLALKLTESLGDDFIKLENKLKDEIPEGCDELIHMAFRARDRESKNEISP